jgi:2-octaprenyl-6-methoxyphenol hydroxylase
MCTEKARIWANGGKAGSGLVNGKTIVALSAERKLASYPIHDDEQRHMKSPTAEVAVVGGGPAGLTTAIALAMAGVETVIVGQPLPSPDHRTTALLTGSVAALTALGVWERCRDHAAALRVMRVVDDTARLLRAPEVSFDAAEIGLEAFGHNIENHHLLAALAGRARELPALTQVAADAVTVEFGDDRVAIACSDGTAVTARLAVGADGRRSICRSAAGIETDRHDYPQMALVCNVAHSRPHRDTSTEFHTDAGPFTLVPLPGRRSSLVWVTDRHEAPLLSDFSDDELSTEIERRSHSILGTTAVEPGRGLFPLAVETARRLAARRVVLVGEAAHIIPPIGAQGLNLGLRDAATVGELVVEAHRDSRDVGGDDLTAHYERTRRADVMARTVAVDLLNRSLLTGFLPLQGARGLGLFLLDRIGPLRRAVMREGVTPLASQPRLMRGEVL